jgi:hypothetical protein
MIDHIKCVATLEGDLNDGRLPGIADQAQRTARGNRRSISARWRAGKQVVQAATKNEREIDDVGTH